MLDAAPPAVTVRDAERLVHRHYGDRVTAEPLVSERDRNFLLSDPDGGRSVLKIANAAEDRRFTECQIAVLRHLEKAAGQVVRVPAIVPTRDRRDFFMLDGEGGTHLARRVTWLAGEPVAEAGPAMPPARDLGVALAHLDRALADFTHSGQHPVLPWDLRRAPDLRVCLPLITDAGPRRLLVDVLDGFETRALPRFAALPAQVIHHDANPANILVHGGRISGIIDFGDMLHAPRIAELAVAAAYLRATDGDPLTLTVPLVDGYRSVIRLEDAEIEVLPDLLMARLATTVLLLARRRRGEPAADAWLTANDTSEANALPFLSRLAAQGPERLAVRLRPAEA